MKTLRLALVAAMLLLVGHTAGAAPMGYNVAWQGSSGYSLSGMFSYEDTGQQTVRARDLTSFMIEGFRGGDSIGSFSGRPGLFFYSAGASHMNPLLQAWNTGGPAVGFGCLLTGCGMSHDQRMLWHSITGGTTISVTPKLAQEALPEPATLGLILAGLAAFGLRRRARA